MQESVACLGLLIGCMGTGRLGKPGFCLSWIFEKKIKTEENKMVIADVNTKN
jgi:hypothetical protein